MSSSLTTSYSIGFIGAFDAHRDLIFQTAAEVHSRHRKSRYELVVADFQ
jgi:hypothetical protein